jgi:CelD/BcsL family acetyltransferase involved in cellulose biosynthesis
MATILDPSLSVRTPEFAGITLHTLRRSADLLDHEQAWLQLDQQASSPMQTFAWIEACSATFGRELQMELVIACQDDEVVAAAPFATRRGSPGRRRELFTYRHLCEPVDVAFRDTDALAELATFLAGHSKPLIVERMFAASPTVAALADVLGRSGRVVIRPQAATPWIALDQGWAAPEQKLSSRRRSDFRRACRQAEQMGRVRAEHFAPDEHEVDRLLYLAFEVERRSWKGETGTALADHQAGDFYRRYARRMSQSGQFRVELLHIGEQIAAMQLGVVHQNRYWVLKVGYDPGFSRASPGILLMVEAIKQAVAEDLETYELLGTVEPWIQVWTELERPCVSLRYYPANLSGGLALATDLIGKARCRLRRS